MPHGPPYLVFGPMPVSFRAAQPRSHRARWLLRACQAGPVARSHCCALILLRSLTRGPSGGHPHARASTGPWPHASGSPPTTSRAPRRRVRPSARRWRRALKTRHALRTAWRPIPRPYSSSAPLNRSINACPVHRKNRESREKHGVAGNSRSVCAALGADQSLVRPPSFLRMSFLVSI